MATFRVSRWRFWLYLAGPYLVGSAAGAQSIAQLHSWMFWIHLVFFLFPANLMLYGVNDLFDTDTDALNPKKGSREHRLASRERRAVFAGTAAACALAAAIILAQRSTAAAVTMAAFTALAICYSIPPVRLKTVPILDSASNILYALPGFLGYIQSSGHSPPAGAFVVAGLWTAAMHLYSAVPDIESDRAAGISTTAAVLGRRTALAVCMVLWLAFAVSTAALRILWPWSLAAFVYPAIPAALLLRRSDATEQVYWYFPAVNSLLGMAGFFLVALNK